MLHQLNKGVFGEHIVNWSTAILGEREMDRRTKGMPRFQKLRHFAQGISVISQWTGKESKAFGSTFLPLVAGHRKADLAKAARAMLDFMYCAHMPEISEQDLATMEEDLIKFDRAKTVFVDRNVEKLLCDEDRFHNFPKFHMPTHYPFLIRKHGVPDGYNTEITERLHIECVKEPWRASNHVHPLQQMITYLAKKEAWTLLRAYLHDTGLLLDRRFTDLDDDDDDEREEEDVVEGDGEGNEGGTWQPALKISIAKRLALGTRDGHYLIDKHGAGNLIDATISYLQDNVPPGTSLPLFPDSRFKVWRRCKLHHERLPFYPALHPQTDQVRAFPWSIDEEGRILRPGFFDVILYSPAGNDSSNSRGLH
ncbi:hypothetical protein FRC06_009771, partial [Ceratobasidium sp. 370]